MYSEIQALVVFLSTFLYNKLPRRKVQLLNEQFANFLVQKLAECWYPMEPHRDASKRCIRINVNGEMEPLISIAASSVGLELTEVANNLPMELTVWVNPGEVNYRVGQNGPLIVLYSARDTSSAALNHLLSTNAVPRSVDAAGGELKLSLEQQHDVDEAAEAPSTSNKTSGNSSPGGLFELSSPNDMKFTVGSFAMTRFGTTKLKSGPTAVSPTPSPVARVGTSNGNGNRSGAGSPKSPVKL